MDPTSDKLEPSALEQRLLEAARGDRIPDALSARMAHGLGLEASATALGASGKLAAPLFAKAGVWGGLCAALLAVGAYQLTRPIAPSEHSEAAPAVAMPAEVNAAPAPVIASAPEPVPHEAPVAVEREEPVVAKRVLVPDDAALRAETALLSRAHAALQAGQSAQALRLLDQHAKRFPAALLAPEADALRIEALAASGAHARAEVLAARFEREHPSHPLRERVNAALQ